VTGRPFLPRAYARAPLSLTPPISHPPHPIPPTQPPLTFSLSLFAQAAEQQATLVKEQARQSMRAQMDMEDKQRRLLESKKEEQKAAAEVRLSLHTACPMSGTCRGGGGE
jgi:hypothetical protein